MQTVKTSLRKTQRPAISAATTDFELAQCAASGDDLAFESIMRRHNRLLFRTARSVLKSDAEAEDTVQEAYLCAWRALATFRAESKLSTWLVRIVINEALGRLRRSSAQVIPLDTAMESTDPDPQETMQDDPDQRPEQVAMRAQVRRLMEARIDLFVDNWIGPTIAAVIGLAGVAGGLLVRRSVRRELAKSRV